MTQTEIPKLPPLRDGDPLEPERSSAPAGDAPPALSPRPDERATRPRGRARGERRDHRPRPPAPEPDRRLWSAGHGLVVMVLALALALLLNAPGAHKRAFNEPDGWKRDVALAITGPLQWVSHALLLDRPRAAVQAAIGRSGADEIDTDVGIEVAAPTTPAAAPAAAQGSPGSSGAATAAKPPAKPAFSPQRKLRIWVAGDSLVITPGYAIVRAAGASAAMETLGVDGRVATGLTRPDVFNWFREIRSQLATRKPNVVVLAFGGNDDKAYMTGLPDGVSIGRFGDGAWQKEYRRRVRALFDAAERAGAHTVWIGLPQTRNAEQTARFDVVNAAVAAEANRRQDSVTYLDTYLLFAGRDGGFAEAIAGPTGDSVKVRASDGVHFERAGGDMIAREVLKALNQKFDLTSWKTKQRQAATD
jgi:hypothetical protein